MGIRNLLLAILQVYSWLLLTRVVISWLNPNPRNELLLMVIKVTDPILKPLSGSVTLGTFDFGPILALFLIRILMKIIA